MSLPNSYTTHLETLADAAGSSGRTFTTFDFITKAMELSSKHQLRANRNPKAAQKDAALHTSDACNKPKKGTSSKRDIECFNCRKKGHFAHDCRGPGGAKEGQHPSKGHAPRVNDSAANAATSMQDGAWSAVIPGPIEITILEPLLSSPWIDDDDDAYTYEMPPGRDSIDTHEEKVIDFTPLTQLVSTALAHVAPQSTPEVRLSSELYDSGATRHMTPYRQSLVNYATITPKPINAANQLTFRAIGRGDLPIRVFNGPSFSNITLRNVLYTPDIAQTLVSVGLIDDAGYTVTFTGVTCIIGDAA